MKNKLTLFLLIFCLLVSTTVGAQIREFERSTPEAEGVPSGALIALMDSLMRSEEHTSELQSHA